MKFKKHGVIVRQEGKNSNRSDDLIIEAPLEVFINDRPAYFCMRMPGMDRELALGICFHDNLLSSIDDIKTIAQMDDGTIRLTMAETRGPGSEEIRIIRSSSGVFCRDRDFRALLPERGPENENKFSASLLFAMQDDFFNRQEVFVKTGGAHAAAIYGRDGGFLAFAEDVGRHNALDKCVGRLLFDRKLHDSYFCMLSSRLSYEMVMKSGRAGVRVIAAFSAPTSLAVKLARDNELTLIGFLRQPNFNVYAGDERLQREPSPEQK
ncbi:MAG: formate dehydrogenase accessory sulfurtransferase FdhD [Acidobacteriota bacterium]|nr:formate dehydrogenase accessory sulfurtransferase FdhD [Acidobacteriota bacterium]